MKKIFISFFSLLLFAATTTATAQDPKPKLAVLVVGMDDWMIGDVLAHLVGEELNRDKNYEVVTRRNDVQNKLEALRRGTDGLADDLLCAWATGQGISSLCLVTTAHGLNFSLRLLDVSSGEVQCSGSNVEPNAVALKQLAWSLTGSIGSSCAPSEPSEPEPAPSSCPSCPVCFGSGYTETSIGMEMVFVEGSTFTMGCLDGRDNVNGTSCNSNEEPSHSVLVNTFWIGKYEVTQGQWEAVMGTTIEQQRAKASSSTLYGVGDNYPMYYVNWHEAKAFCDTLSSRTGKVYRLATEKEWEYAARGGKSSAGCLYSGGTSILGNVAWYNSNSSSSSHAVGGKSGNELGIHDMSGNVNEWCSSNWRNDYSSAEETYFRVFRGGSWDSYTWGCRVANRSYNGPSERSYGVGFRVV
jgi:formylglycine-generating enzyme required for sulfatase activity